MQGQTKRPIHNSIVHLNSVLSMQHRIKVNLQNSHRMGFRNLFEQESKQFGL